MTKDELKLIIAEQEQRMIQQREACKVKRLEDAKKLNELINHNDLETLIQLVIKRSEVGAVLKTASVESYINALKAYHVAVIAVLEFSNEWVQDIQTGLLLFKINDQQYLIKERKNGPKYIGYVTEKEETK